MRVDVSCGDVLREQLDGCTGVALRVVTGEHDRFRTKLLDGPTQTGELCSWNGEANWRASRQRGLKLHRALHLYSIIFQHVAYDARGEVGKLHLLPTLEHADALGCRAVGVLSRCWTILPCVPIRLVQHTKVPPPALGPMRMEAVELKRPTLVLNDRRAVFTV